MTWNSGKEYLNEGACPATGIRAKGIRPYFPGSHQAGRLVFLEQRRKFRPGERGYDLHYQAKGSWLRLAKNFLILIFGISSLTVLTNSDWRKRRENCLDGCPKSQVHQCWIRHRIDFAGHGAFPASPHRPSSLHAICLRPCRIGWLGVDEVQWRISQLSHLPK